MGRGLEHLEIVSGVKLEKKNKRKKEGATGLKKSLKCDSLEI